MKPMSFNQKNLIDYLYITFKSTTPLLGGVVIRGVALQCPHTITHLPISAIYGLIWIKPTPFNQIFLMDNISITFKCSTPL